jgi:hypothetical protein
VRYGLRSLCFCVLVCAAAMAAMVGRSDAFLLHSYRWPSGADIVMHLDLGAAPIALQDRSASWDASAANALAVWNEHLASVRLTAAGPVAASGGDRTNSVFFSETIYGQAFGPNTLAVTVQYNPDGYVFTETDVIFNSRVRYDSYRGPIQEDAAGRIYDFHRVALHEFGHVLGLDHPDEQRQPGVPALMNAVISDLDRLAQDDIDGAIYIYGGKITSSLAAAAQVGTRFHYQIAANHKPTEFGAHNLPAGLQIDPFTGIISGIPAAAGQFEFSIRAYSRYST